MVEASLNIAVPPELSGNGGGPPTPGTAAARAAEVALAVTAEKPESDVGGRSGRLSSYGKARKLGRITLADLDDGAPEIRPRAPTKLEKKMQAARASFHDERSKRSRQAGMDSLQHLFMQSDSGSMLESQDAHERPQSAGPQPSGRRSARKARDVSPSAPAANLNLSILPTATDQWQADKNLYYSPVSCTSSMAPHKFPATLRAGMLLYYTPMQRERTLESVADTNARGDEQAAANAESFQAGLQDIAGMQGPSARALDLFRLAGDPEALIAAGDKLSVWVHHLAYRARVHPDTIWGLLEQGEQQGDPGTALEGSQGSVQDEQQALQGFSSMRARSGRSRARSKSAAVLEGALRRDPVANENGYITPAANGYVSGLQARAHSRGQDIIQEGMDRAQYMYTAQTGEPLPGLAEKAPPLHRGHAVPASEEAALAQALNLVEDVYRVGPRQRTARRQHKAQSGGAPQAAEGAPPLTSTQPSHPLTSTMSGDWSECSSCGSPISGPGGDPAYRHDAGEHSHSAKMESLPTSKSAPLQQAPYLQQPQQQQQQQQRQQYPHQPRFSPNRAAAPVSKSWEPAPTHAPQSLLYKTFMDGSSADLVHSAPPPPKTANIKPSAASPSHPSLAPTTSKPHTQQQANTSSQPPHTYARPAHPSARPLNQSSTGTESRGLPQTSRAHSLLKHANKSLQLPKGGVAEVAGSAAVAAEPPARDAGGDTAAPREQLQSRESLGFEGLDLTEPSSDEDKRVKAQGRPRPSISGRSKSATSSAGAPISSPQMGKMPDRPLLTKYSPRAKALTDAKTPRAAQPLLPLSSPPPAPPPTNFQALRQGLHARTAVQQRQRAEAEARASAPYHPAIEVPSQQHPEGEAAMSNSRAYFVASYHPSPSHKDLGASTGAAGGVDPSGVQQTGSQGRHVHHEEQQPGDPPSMADKHLQRLRTVEESRASTAAGTGSGSRSNSPPSAAPKGASGHVNAHAHEAGGHKVGSPARAQTSSSARSVGPKILDHKLRPLRMAKPAPPLLVFSSGLADSYKMITQVNEARQVKHRLLSAEKQLTPLALKRLQQSGIS